MNTVQLSIDGMSCGRCVDHVAAALDAMDGVKVERVGVGSAEVTLDPSKSSPAALVKVLDGIGYPAQASSKPAPDANASQSVPQKQGCCCGQKP